MYSKSSGEVPLDSSIRSTKHDDLLVLENVFKDPQKEIKEICQILKQYGSLRVTIRDKVYIKYVEKQDISKIIEENPKLNLIPYRQRALYKCKQLL